MRQKILFLVSADPWHARARAALDFVMTAAVLDQEVHLCFWGDAVAHLLPEQDGAGLGLKTLAQQLPALELYGIMNVYAERAMFDRLGMNTHDLSLPVVLIDRSELQLLLQSCDVVEHAR
jgi:sulfur relay protein TusC/DsrF